MSILNQPGLFVSQVWNIVDRTATVNHCICRTCSWKKKKTTTKNPKYSAEHKNTFLTENFKIHSLRWVNPPAGIFCHWTLFLGINIYPSICEKMKTFMACQYCTFTKISNFFKTLFPAEWRQPITVTLTTQSILIQSTPVLFALVMWRTYQPGSFPLLVHKMR